MYILAGNPSRRPLNFLRFVYIFISKAKKGLWSHKYGRIESPDTSITIWHCTQATKVDCNSSRCMVIICASSKSGQAKKHVVVSQAQIPSDLALFHAARTRWKDVLMPLLPPRGAGFTGRKRLQGWSSNTPLTTRMLHKLFGWLSVVVINSIQKQRNSLIYCYWTNKGCRQEPRHTAILNGFVQSLNFSCQQKYRASIRPLKKKKRTTCKVLEESYETALSELLGNEIFSLSFLFWCDVSGRAEET